MSSKIISKKVIVYWLYNVIIIAITKKENQFVNKVKKFLKDLRSSKSFKETLDIIIDFRASNGEMNVP